MTATIVGDIAVSLGLGKAHINNFCNLKEVVKKATFTALLDDAIAIAKHAGIQDEECNGRSVIEHIKRIQKQHAQDWDEYEALTTTIEAFLVSPPPSATSAAGTFGYFTAYFQKLCEALKVGEKDVDLLKSQLLVALMWCRESNLLKSGPPFKIKSLPWEEFPAAFDPVYTLIVWLISKEILNGKLFIVTERLLSAEIWMDKEFKAWLFLKLSEKHTADSWSCVYKLLCLEPMLEIVSDRNVDIVVMLSIHTVGQLSDTKPSFKDITNAYSKTDFCSEERLASTSVISPSSLTHIEARWSKLPEAEQGAIADHLAELQKGDWKSLTLEQKRAIYFIAYGPYGARTPSDPALNRKVTAWVGAFLVATFGLWVAWESSKPQPKTFSKEWVEAQDKLAIERKQNPFSGAYAKVLAEESKTN
nr:Cytochrome c oxidase subunit 5A [Polyrhizophydium stewartii]